MCLGPLITHAHAHEHVHVHRTFFHGSVRAILSRDQCSSFVFGLELGARRLKPYCGVRLAGTRMCIVYTYARRKNLAQKIARAGAASRAATRLACLYWRLFLRERAEVPSNRAAERIDVIAALQNADDGHRAAAANRRHHRRRDLPVDWHVVHGSRRYERSDYAARSVAPTQNRRRCTRGPRAGPPRARRSPR